MLSTLKKVTDLRKIWKNEAQDFTQWLAQKENLDILANEIGLDILPIDTESSVGSFNVDILAEEDGGDRSIVIENQLESSNHDHLGKIITYASGFEAEIIIWIVKRAREEHRKAVEWLNEKTEENVNVFLVELELWQIGDSEPAVKFNVIAQPNNWAKTLKQSQKTELSDIKKQQLKFWTNFREYAIERGVDHSLRSPKPKHGYVISLGSSEAHISLSLNSLGNEVKCEIYIKDNKGLYAKLFENKDKIETEIGSALIWENMPHKKACRIEVKKKGHINKADKWPEYYEWLFTHANKFRQVFPKYIQ